MSTTKKNHVTPQSSLGELGKSLLKFIAPVLRIKAHATNYDYLDEAVHKTDFAKSTLVAVKTVGATSGVLKAGAAVSVQSAAQAPGSIPGLRNQQSTITVTREPATPWIHVVTNLIQDCESSVAHTRSVLGANVYQSAKENKAELRRKTVGRIINLTTEDDTTDFSEVEKKPSEQKAASSKMGGAKKAA